MDLCVLVRGVALSSFVSVGSIGFGTWFGVGVEVEWGLVCMWSRNSVWIWGGFGSACGVGAGPEWVCDSSVGSGFGWVWVGLGFGKRFGRWNWTWIWLGGGIGLAHGTGWGPNLGLGLGRGLGRSFGLVVLATKLTKHFMQI